MKKWGKEDISSRYSPKARSATRRPMTQTRFIVRYCLFDAESSTCRTKAGEAAQTALSFTAATPPLNEPTPLSSWRLTNGSAPRTSVDQSAPSSPHTPSNQIAQHKSMAERRVWMLLVRGEWGEHHFLTLALKFDFLY